MAIQEQIDRITGAVSTQTSLISRILSALDETSSGSGSTPIEQNTVDLRKILDAINILLGNDSDDTLNCLYLVDHETNQNYMIYVYNGDLHMEVTDDVSVSNDYYYFVDQTTEQAYTIYVSAGKLIMDADNTENENIDRRYLLDQMTDEQFMIYVTDGKLMMTMVEE